MGRFQKNSNTLSATMDLMDHLALNLDRGKIMIAVLIDLRKAFDVVDHGILLDKLERMGFRGVILKLIQTYLCDRKHYIGMDKVKSKIALSNCGVPQGSVLGPLLYSLFVLSLQLSELSAKYFTFADDTVLTYCGDSVSLLSIEANNDLNRYYKWLLQQNLKLNLNKTHDFHTKK